MGPWKFHWRVNWSLLTKNHLLDPQTSPQGLEAEHLTGADGSIPQLHDVWVDVLLELDMI